MAVLLLVHELGWLAMGLHEGPAPVVSSVHCLCMGSTGDSVSSVLVSGSTLPLPLSLHLPVLHGGLGL